MSLARLPTPYICGCCPIDVYPILVLSFICILTFGSYWVYDTPGAIQTQITAWFGGPDKYSDAENLTLYSVYSYPNIILALFGGYVIDNYLGVRLGTFLFSLCVLLGQTIFAVGIQFEVYWVCVMGRFVFGLGGESLTVGQNYYASKWFADKIALAFGVVLAFSRIGSAVNFAITPPFADIGVPFSVWFGVLMCLMSFTGCVCLTFVDWYASSRFPPKDERENPGDDVKLSYILDFPLQSWVIFLICVFFYVSILTFYTVASDILQHTGQQFPPDTATLFLLIPNLVAIPASPLFGFLIDKYGKSLYWLILSSFMPIVGHIVFLLMAIEIVTFSPAFIMVWLGIGYSMFAASIWPLLPYVIRGPMLGTAYGAMTSIQNLGLAIFPQIIGAVQGASGIEGTIWEYIIPIIIFASCAGVAMGLSIVLLGIDNAKTGGILNKDGILKEEYKKKFNQEYESL